MSFIIEPLETSSMKPHDTLSKRSLHGNNIINCKCKNYMVDNQVIWIGNVNLPIVPEGQHEWK